MHNPILDVEDEWHVIQSLLPEGWLQAAKTLKAFLRVRYLPSAGDLLRLLLFHAISDNGLRLSVAQASISGIAHMSQVALFKRLKKSSDWLAWIANQLCNAFRNGSINAHGLRLRAVDSTTVQGPASKGTEWRVHYALDLETLSCDWFELTDEHGAELLERTPVKEGDLIIADRNYLRYNGVKATTTAGGDVLVRLKWKHTCMTDLNGQEFHALDYAKKLKVAEVGEWKVVLRDGKNPKSEGINSRVIITKLPKEAIEKAERKKLRQCQKKGVKNTNQKTIEAVQYIMLFTTLPEAKMNASGILELYRYRWQVELAFKRHKQLLKLGQLPHKDPQAARGWIQAKLVVVLILETLHRNARCFSPWGFNTENLKHTSISH